MIENSKQQQLTFDKGITNVPSDAVCSDNALEDCVGLVYDNGEHRVIQRPEEFIKFLLNYKLLYVHKFNDEDRYICFRSEDNAIIWGTNESGTFERKGTILKDISSTNLKVTSIGKVVIISTEDTIVYALWKNGAYKAYEKIPEPKGVFDILFTSVVYSKFMSFENSLDYDEKNKEFKTKDEKDADYDNLVLGMYAENKKRAARKGYFVNPFLARYALELYDGSYTYISNPVMIFPSVTRSSYMWHKEENQKRVCLVTRMSALAFSYNEDYSDWSDIVKKIVIFVSDQADIYDTSDNQPDPKRFADGDYVSDGIYSYAIGTNNIYRKTFANSTSTFYDVLKRRHGSENNSIKEELENLSVFYRIGEIGVNNKKDFFSISLQPHVLENLTTQEQLQNDDYFSHCKVAGSAINAYNGRLNLANIRRGFFEGFSQFMPYNGNEGEDVNEAYDTEHNYQFIVTIKTDENEKVIVKHSASTKNKQGLYFYYPDPRATHVVIIKDGKDCVCDEELTEHPSLNGAYFFRGLPGITKETLFLLPNIPEGDNNDDMEKLQNHIIYSEVNNPFVFKAEGYVAVGNSKVIGMSSLTQALSQGQFGQYPLIVFSEEGIWAVSINATGILSSVHPMSREVCNNPDSVTQTDGAVFFSSAKGLMVVAGSTVKCVSEQLAGRSDTPFTEFIRNAVLAYDYRDSLLWVFSKSGARHAYVYAIRSGTFSRYDFGAAQVTNVVNAYPDYLLQSGNTVYSLMRRANINDDPSAYAATIVTRPMKLENALALKSLIQVIHIHDMQGSFVIRIYVSNDLKHWAEIHSLRGTPWKYYRIRYEFTDLRATDRFAGTVIVTHERRTNKLR